MSRRRRVVLVSIAGLVAGVVAHFVDPDGSAAALIFLSTGLVLGELLVLRLEDGSAIPLSYAVLMVLASSFTLPQYACAVIGAELISAVLRVSDRSNTWRFAIFVERIAVAAATYAAYRLTWNAIPLDKQETVAAVLGALAV